MRVQSILTCSEYDEEAEDDNLIGIQFILGIKGKNETVPLESFGNVNNDTGACNMTEVSSSPHMLKISGDSSSSGVNNIKIKYSYVKLVVGRTGKEDFSQWYIASNRPLIGFYGR